MSSPSGFIPPHGNYRELLSYQKAEVIYDITFRFCEAHLKRNDRTIDQMVQAARSGKQNIVEASAASGTSKQTEIKLLGVARASLEELLNDYQDYLRVRNHQQWTKDSKEATFARRIGHGTHVTYPTYQPYLEGRPPETIANLALCLIHQANYLLDRQIKSAEADFLQNGGIRERMTKARLETRSKPR